MRLVVLCINLDRAGRRWAALQQSVLRSGLPGNLVRIQAVDGRDPADLTQEMLTTHVTTHVRWNLMHRTQVCDRTLLNTRESVACYLSHRRAWQWLRDHAYAYDVALILEDDCCVDTPLADALRGLLSPLLMRPPYAVDWDVLFLGYHDLLPAAMRPSRQRVTLPSWTGSIPVWLPDRYVYGAHCYAVSQPGAVRLLERSLPAELHVDFWMVVLAQMGQLRAWLAPESLASQCRREVEASIPHMQWDVMNFKLLLPDVTIQHARWWMVVVLVGVVGVGGLFLWICRRRRTGPQQQA